MCGSSSFNTIYGDQGLSKPSFWIAPSKTYPTYQARRRFVIIKMSRKLVFLGIFRISKREEAFKQQGGNAFDQQGYPQQ